VNQTLQSVLPKRRLSLVEGHTRQPKGFGRVGDPLPIPFHTAKHLVFHLNHIPGVEEVALLKRRILHGFGTAI
jgi:hypothetical protein